MGELKTGNYIIGENYHSFIIAEAGSNYNRNINKAKEPVDITVEAGANAVKFQTFKRNKVFLKLNTANEIVKKYEFKLEWHIKKVLEEKLICISFGFKC